jgi:hypothetical protein
VNWHNESPLYNECMLKNNKEIIFIISHWMYYICMDYLTAFNVLLWNLFSK